ARAWPTCAMCTTARKPCVPASSPAWANPRTGRPSNCVRACWRIASATAGTRKLLCGCCAELEQFAVLATHHPGVELLHVRVVVGGHDHTPAMALVIGAPADVEEQVQDLFGRLGIE